MPGLRYVGPTPTRPQDIALLSLLGAGTLPVTRSGSNLQVDGVNRRFSGANAYWVGLDDNQGIAYPTKTQITNALVGAREMGSNLIRAHTIGMSAGRAESFETAPGTFVDANLDRADWAVAEAKRLGIYLIVPLTDHWNYYHGGKGVFVHWAYQQNPSGITALPAPGQLFNSGETEKGAVEENQFYANTTAGLRIRALFTAYITAWMNHVNPYTGLAYKDDPTLAFIETGNELFSATAEWTQAIAAHIKTLAPGKFVACGSAATGLAVANQPGLNAAAVDILGSHYYPTSDSGGQTKIGFTATPSRYGTSTTALQQLAADAAAAKAAGKVFLAGEYPWTRSDVASWYSAVEGNADIAGDLFWSLIAADLAHGFPFGSDDYPVHRPYLGTQEQQYAPALARHTSAVSGVAVSNGAGTESNLISSAAFRDASDASIWSGGNGTLAVDTTTAKSGGSSLRVTGNGGYPYFAPTSATLGAPVTAGKQYRAAAYFLASSSGRQMHVRILWYGSDGVVITYVDGAAINVPVGSWLVAAVTATAPANAVRAGIQFQADLAIAASATVNVDEFSIAAV